MTSPAVSTAKLVNHETAQDLLKQFLNSVDTYRTTASKVQSSHSSMLAIWNGQAANAYAGSLEQWLSGFAKVRQALEQISDEMAVFASETATTDDDNRVKASNWASDASAGNWAAGH